MERHERRELSAKLMRLAEPYRQGTDMHDALTKAALQLLDSEREMNAAFQLNEAINFFQRNSEFTWSGKRIAIMLTPDWYPTPI